VKEKEGYDKLHEGRFSGSKLGCPRAQALHVLGHEAVYGKKLEAKFEEGGEHDEEMKREAEEEFEDFWVPNSRIIRLTRGETTAEISLSPDGLRDEEVVEFKGLAASFWNSLHTEEDLKIHSPLTKKYYNQVQAYAGAFKKPKIRFRIKNKRNLKVRDIVFKSKYKYWEDLKNQIMDIQEILDKGGLPPRTCSRKEEKRCLYKKACREAIGKEIENMEKIRLSSSTKSELSRLVELYLERKNKIDVLEAEQDKLRLKVKDIMRTHGQREQELVPGTVLYGVRYKERRNAEDIEELVNAGKIRMEEAPEEYCSIFARGEEEEEPNGKHKRQRKSKEGNAKG